MSSNTAAWWFAALDGKLVAIDDECWTAEVVGTHVAGPDLWIQLAAADDPSRSALVHIRSTASRAKILSRLSPENREVDRRIDRHNETAEDPLQLTRQ